MIYILGPCAIESEETYLKIGKYLYDLMQELQIENWYYKASFDKANRTSIKGRRGICQIGNLNLANGIELFDKIKKELPNIKLTTDIHQQYQAAILSNYIDLIQIPAFLCRQSDLLIECAVSFDKINIKKGQWCSPTQSVKWIDKIKETNPNCEAWITERGTFFGYDRLVLDFGGVEYMKRGWDKVILDSTHSTQYTRDGFTGGNRELGKKYFKAASIFEFDGVFAECHPNPKEAISDADCQINLNDIEQLILKQKAIERINNEN